MVYIVAAVLVMILIYYHVYSRVDDSIRSRRLCEAEEARAADFRSPEILYDATGQPRRFCPVCKAELGNTEKIYGEIYKGEAGNKDRILVKGCRRCSSLPAISQAPDYSGPRDL